jgi:uncharacterized protein
MRGYHEGQRAVQERAGTAGTADRLARGFHDVLPDGAREFLAEQPLLIAAGSGPDGLVWASPLTGAAATPDERTVAVAGGLPAGDPLAATLAAGPAPLGILAIDAHTRRRIRIDGTAERTPGGLRITAERVFGNCPKYIARRAPEAAAPPADGAAAGRERPALDAGDRALIAAADTFFLATTGPDGSADASHRGGSPGFVDVRDARHLTFPDYAGNTMYMSLGNVAATGRAGLLLVDWETGDILQVSGRAEIDWSRPRAARFPGAQRVVDVAIERVRATAGVLPGGWVLEERSRFNPPAPVSSPA